VDTTEYELPPASDAVRAAELVTRYGLPHAPKTAFYPPLGGGGAAAAGGGAGGGAGGSVQLYQKDAPLGSFHYAAVWGSDLRSFM
jgi:hypothetical protein